MEGFSMSNKPTYEELAERIRAFEEEAAQRRRLEDRLHLLSSAIEQSSEGMAVVDLDGNLVYLNEAFAKMHGYSPEELTGKNLLIFHTPQQLPSVEGANRQLTERGVFQGEIWHARRDGTVFPTLMHNSTLRDEAGRPIGMIGTVREITDMKRSEEILRRENAYLISLHETIIGLMSRLDLNDLLQAISVRAAALVGTQHAFVYLLDPENGELVMRVGLGIYERTVGVRLAPGKGLAGRILETGQPLVVDNYGSWSNRAADSRFDDLRSIIGAPLKTGDQVSGVIGMSHTDPSIRFGEDDMVMLSRFAELASVALDNAYLYADLQRELVERSRVEEVLRESEARYRSVFENTGTATVIIEEDRTISMANTEFERLSGYPRGEIEGLKKWTEFAAREDLEIMATYHEERRKSEEKAPSEYEFRFVDREGNTKHVLIKIGMIPGTRQSVSSLLDITARKRFEDQLRESEKRFRKFANEASSEGIIIHHNGKTLDVNERFSAMYGYEYSEMIGRNILDMIAPEYREPVWKYIRDDYEKSYDAVGLRKDGSHFPIEIHAHKMPFHGKTAFAATILDISERKRAEEFLRREEEKFRILVEESPFAVSLIGKDGRYKYVNPKFVEFFGYTLEDIPTGREWFSKAYPDPKYRKEVIALWKSDHRKAQAGEAYPRELNVTVKDGSIKTIRFRSVTMESGGQFVICEDITKSKHLEAQLLQAQKMEATGTLAGGIAHDFNNLLQAILGYTQMMLLDKGREDPESERLREIEKAALRANELTLQLLTFSRKVESNLRPVDLNQEVRQVEKLLRRTIPKMIDIVLRLEDGLSIINADPAQMEQILMNLAVNARDAMPEGGKIIFETENIALDMGYRKAHLGIRPGNYVLLSVSDTGHGMDKEILEHIFDPFYTTKETGKGTGLGLAMVYGIVKNHGGDIMCYSEPGEGTIFKIYLPATEKEKEEERAPIERELPRGGSETILLVDDEPFLRDLGELMLTKFGYRVLAAADGESALALYRKRQEAISLVILDLIMPGMGGGRCLEELLKIDPRVRVVISSGYSVNGPTKEALEAGARGFVGKPYEVRQMLKVVRAVLDEEE
jgi:two-component system cell cycle sensor histidine kinase/response regulator CckA